MMVLLTGRERTLSEYRALLKKAGLRLSKSTPIRSPLAVIEAVAACSALAITVADRATALILSQ
jgi:hypothetical protein